MHYPQFSACATIKIVNCNRMLHRTEFFIGNFSLLSMSKNLDLKRFDQKLWLLNMHRHTGLNFLRISEACVGNFERWETMYWNIHLHYSSWERIEGKNFCLCQNHKKWKKKYRRCYEKHQSIEVNYMVQRRKLSFESVF